MVVTVSKISTPNIREQLNKLWDKEQGEDKIKASLFNLIVYVQDKEKITYYEQLIQTVISKFPSRVLFLICTNHTEENDLHITVSSQTVGEGDLKIFCEMIRIEAKGQYIQRIPFLVIPHILADLPVYLLWTQDPSFEHTILPHLEPIATRIIFNADSTHSLQTFSSSVLSLMHQFKCEIGDLHWDAIEGWRRLIYETFNDRDTFLVLGQAHHVIITYNNGDQNHHHGEIQAAYLQAWLAARLNWNLETFELVEGNVRLCYRRPLNEVVVLLRPTKEPTLPLGSIVRLEIHSLKDEGYYLFDRNIDLPQVHIHYSDTQQCLRPVSSFLKTIPSGQEIIQEIFYPRSKEHYIEMLDLLSKTPWRAD